VKISEPADAAAAPAAYRRAGQQRTRRPTMSNLDRLARLVPLAGVVSAVLTVAGYSAIGPFPDTDASIAKLTSFYAANHGGVATGGLLLSLAAISLAVFGTAVWARIRATDLHPVVAGAALVGTAMTATAGLISAGAYQTLGEIGDQRGLSPAALQAWHINGSAGVVDGGSVILLLAAATAGIAGRAFPRWLAWPALVLAILQLIPISPYGFFASLVVLVWTAVTSVIMIMRPVEEMPARTDSLAPALRSGPALPSR
jgi:hypothetical protein